MEGCGSQGHSQGSWVGVSGSQSNSQESKGRQWVSEALPGVWGVAGPRVLYRGWKIGAPTVHVGECRQRRRDPD